MKNPKTWLVSTCVLAGLLIAGSAAASPLILSLDAPFQTIGASAGNVLTYYGTVINTDAAHAIDLSEVFDSLNLYGTGGNQNLVDIHLSLDDTGFWNNLPFSLAPGESTGAFELFTVTVGNGVLPGLYEGSFAITDSSDPTLNLASAVFDVNVVSEPPSLLLVGGLLLALLFTQWKRRRV